MRNLIIFTTLFILCLVFVVPGILALFIKIVPFNDQPGYSTDYKRWLHGSIIAAQTFTSGEDRLTGIGLSIGNPNLLNKKDVILKLYDSQDFEKVTPSRVVKINGQSIPDGAFVRFLFEPIADAKNKKYIFTIASPEATGEEVINIFFTKDHPSWMGELTQGGDVFTEAIPFVAYHKPVSRIGVTVDIYRKLLLRLVGKTG